MSPTVQWSKLLGSLHNLKWLVKEEVDEFLDNQCGFDPYRDLVTEEEVRALAADEGAGVAKVVRENELITLQEVYDNEEMPGPMWQEFCDAFVEDGALTISSAFSKNGRSGKSTHNSSITAFIKSKMKREKGPPFWCDLPNYVTQSQNSAREVRNGTLILK